MRRFKHILGFFTVFLCVLVLNTVRVQASPTDKRLGGIDRYDTSVKISIDQWSSSENVILVSGENFPDALCASPLSKKLNAPILLTETKELNAKVLVEIQRLGTKNVYIIGGTGVISDNVENTLKNLGINVVRIAGNDRYETSIEVAKYLGTITSAVIASGESFPDALSIASIAGAKQMPILLTDKNNLPASVESFIKDNNIAQGYIVGGTGVVSSNIESKLAGYKRLAGADRFLTNAAIINEFINELSFDSIFIATASDYPDALAGSASAAKLNSPIFLTDGALQLKDSTLLIKLKDVKTLRILGAASVVTDAAVDNLIVNVVFSEVFEYKYHDNTLQYYVNRQFTLGGNVIYGGGTVTLDNLTYYMNPANFVSDDRGKYMFLKLDYRNGVTVEDLNRMLSGKGILNAKGQAFLTGGQTHNVNPIYLVAHSLLETGNGTSKLANGILVSSVDGIAVEPKMVYNMYGVGAYDSDPNRCGSEYAYKHGWFTVDAAIIGGAEFISQGYINSTRKQDTLYKMKWNFVDIWHEYATDIGWAYKQTYVIKQLVAQTKNSVLYFEIPVFK